MKSHVSKGALVIGHCMGKGRRWSLGLLGRGETLEHRDKAGKARHLSKE